MVHPTEYDLAWTITMSVWSRLNRRNAEVSQPNNI